MERPSLVRPGEFSIKAAADGRRGVYDYHNEAILACNLPVGTVFMGDSITEMWALDAFFRTTAGAILNRGIGGDRTEFARRRFEADVLQLRPRLLVQMLGINNSWDMSIWWDAALRRTGAEVEAQVLEDSSSMVHAARERGIAVALCSILPTCMVTDGAAADRNTFVARTNARLRELADREGAIYVDYHRRFTQPDGLTLRTELADDGLHPHVLGYAIMADELCTVLAKSGISFLERRQ